MKRFLFAMLISFVGLVCAQTTPAPQAPASGTHVNAGEARAVVLNREIFTFRSAASGVSATDRARRAARRIREQLELPGPNKVTLAPDVDGILVQIDNATSFVVHASDADPTLGETVASRANAAKAALEVAINESRESRNVHFLLLAALKVALATLVVLGLIRLALLTRRKLLATMLSATQRQSERLQLGGVKLVHSERLAMAVRMALNTLYRIILFILAYNWLSFVLSCFPYTRIWGETLNTFLIQLLASMGAAALQAVPDMVTAGLIFFIAKFASNLLHSFFERVQNGQIELTWLDADVVAPTRRIAKTLVWLFALAMAYPYLPGSDTEAFKGLSVLAGLMISLGASNLVGQAASGLILTYGRVFRKGEYVRVAGSEGTVTEVGMFATRIRTGLGEELTIANSKIMEHTTTNYSRVVKGGGFVLDTKVTIGYDTPWRQVEALLIEAARRTEGVLMDPKPVVFQTALSDWYPEYRLVCQAVPAEPRPRALLLSGLHANIQDVFSEYGVQIMSPQYFEDPPEPKIVKPDNWYPAPAMPPKGQQGKAG
jgi:small-conductance mechanosensitive channel